MRNALVAVFVGMCLVCPQRWVLLCFCCHFPFYVVIPQRVGVPLPLLQRAPPDRHGIFCSFVWSSVLGRDRGVQKGSVLCIWSFGMGDRDARRLEREVRTKKRETDQRNDVVGCFLCYRWSSI